MDSVFRVEHEKEIPEYTEEYICGCESLKQLKQWFHGFWSMLKAENFVIREFKSKKILRGKMQVAFIRPRRYITYEITNDFD